ncbi:DNA topoisomerase 2 [Wickerhamiella sorbophila]|uniref:DNA topoisomerase 2 n=1 Tax=Wickerhamiella sorbophila TaxID=45607 RepID=A0A2T0FMH7_9ASCO|nr:DNA topoisomerase 2 [Wickerhamiella sorbophila]PRT56191.1 DNA topoisomerase 2 [Wickerhamiella sorbophila]
MSVDVDSASGGSTNGTKAKGKGSSHEYQKLSQLEHVLKRPDTYIGSVEFHESNMWVCNENNEVEYKSVNIVPGFYKVFDEILVNAADNKVRDPSMTSIQVIIDTENNQISVRNDGKGIPIEIHEKEKIYIPELIFGNLLTSSNYDDSEQKVTGGRNGFGAKLCNIFSTKFTLETCDTHNTYHQDWSDNMTKVDKPKIKAVNNKKPYTMITFKPDLARFGMEKIDNDHLMVLRRRIFDLAGTIQGVNVKLNGATVPVNNFKNYMNLYAKALSKDDEKVDVLISKPNDRWEVGFALSDGSFNQMSFVNSIATTSGGTHVSHVTEQIVNYALDVMTKKNKGRAGKLTKLHIRSNIFLFINCKINNPSFTSQTKEQLTTKVSAFGSKCELPDKFLKDIMNKTGLTDRLLEITERASNAALKKQDGGRKRRLTEFVKLEDANMAGTKDSSKCTLILTEGDSALTLAVAGLAVIGRDYYGCFPLRGKILNVRDASQEQILNNKEIAALKKIIGLQHKKTYTSTEGLRYGHIMIMTDQDHDGSHIKGLIINFLESLFPGLLDIPGFLLEFITPIVKVTILRNGRAVKVIPFYNMPEFEEWRETEGRTCRWKHKYYKGLGTSTPETEGREYFSELARHEKTFLNLQEGDKERIELAFSKSRADDRKQWLQEYVPGTYLDSNINEIGIKDFIDKELILFSMADNLRSIPSVMDGLKPAQRKVVYSCAQRRNTEIKVASLAGHITEKMGYHHGEQSLQQTIIGLAQSFVGTNNIYYLLPQGGFGSRATGGKDASAARYISTLLNPLARTLFNSNDDPLLNYMQDDESTVEPEHFVPILPTLLVNGTEGIGTGWSTNIPSFNPVDLVENIRRMMNGEALKPLVPWYRGWSGTIEKVPGSDHQFRVCGRIEVINETTLAITELPVRMWTQTMKEFLLKSLIGSSKGDKKLASGEFLDDMTEEHGAGIRFIVKLSKEEMEKACKVGLYNKFKLIAPMSTSNMVAFDPQGRLRRYSTAEDILREFYYVRLDYYVRRKDNMSQQLRNHLERLTSRARFIKMIIDNELVISNRPKRDVIEDLQTLRFPKFGTGGVPVWPDEQMQLDAEELMEPEDTIETTTAGEEVPVVSKTKPSYDYLLEMRIMSLTREMYQRLLRQRDETEEELNILLAKSAKDLWNADLDKFMEQWDEFEKKDREDRETLVRIGGGKKRAAKRKGKNSDDSDDEFGAPKKRTKKAKKTATPQYISTEIVELPPIETFATRSSVKSEPRAKSATPAASTLASTAASTVATEASTPAETPVPPTTAAYPKPKAKAAPRKKSPPKKLEVKEESGAESDSDVSMADVTPVERSPRASRRAAPVRIQISDDEDEPNVSAFVLSEDSD